MALVVHGTVGTAAGTGGLSAFFLSNHKDDHRKNDGGNNKSDKDRSEIRPKPYEHSYHSPNLNIK